MKKNTLFVHSFFRSGSTYIFHAFRRSKNNNFCYQEPLNEFVIKALEQPENLMSLEGAGEMQRLLKHPKIGRPYFAELFDTFEHWKSIITPEISYDDYFGLYAPEKTNAYLSALINASKQKNVVIQECRTGARIGNIKERLGGHHVSLWRNPWDQWWSCKSTEYFESIPQIIASARKIPAVIQKICDEGGIAILPQHSFDQQMRHFEQRWVKPQSSYMLFYALWCINMLEGLKRADMLLSIDELSQSNSYRKSTIDAFSKFGFSKLDFSDCDIPKSVFTVKDAEFFRPIEEKVYEYLVETGVNESDVQGLRKICSESTPVLENVDSLSETERKYVGSIGSLRSMVLTGQEGREREGAHSNTHISILNTRLIDMQKEQAENAGLNDEVKQLSERLALVSAETRDQTTTYQKLIDEKNDEVNSLNLRLDQINVETRGQITTYQTLLDQKSGELNLLNERLDQEKLDARGQVATFKKIMDEQADNVKALSLALETASKQNETMLSNLSQQRLQLEIERENQGRSQRKMTESMKTLSRALEAASKQNETMFSDLMSLQLQLKHEQEHHELLQTEHEGLLDFFQSYEGKTKADIKDQIQARAILTESVDDLRAQTRELDASEKLRESELLGQIGKHEAALQSVLTSTSWRITQPLRGTVNLKTLVKNSVRAKLLGLLQFIRSNPMLRAIAKRLIASVPALQSKADAFSLANPRPSFPVKSTEWNLQLDKNETKKWISALKVEKKT